MKRFLVIFILVIGVLNFSGAIDSTSDVKKFNKIDETGAYDLFLLQNIGKDITVNIIQSDINISGILLSVHKDGIILKSFFSQVFIPKEAIAYVKVKIEPAKK